MSLKTAYFDCAFGAAGDMLVGACIDCGVSKDYIEGELRKLNLPVESFAITAGKVHRASIYASKFDVWIDLKSEDKVDPKGMDLGHDQDHGKESSIDHEHTHSQSDSHSHGHSHSHSQSHSHSHSHSHDHRHSHDHDHESHEHSHDHEVPEHSHEHNREQVSHEDHHQHRHNGGGENFHAPDQPERALGAILEMISVSTLDPAVKDLASRIFECLGRAEACVHGVPVDQIHFHEVGAVDAICDIVGFAVAYLKLGIEVSHVSPLPLGSGTVKTMHGLYPVPGPAVLALLQDAGAKTSALSLPYECLTPTGAAILSTIGSTFGQAPAFERIDSIGYGAGSLNPGTHPNVVRLIVGQGSNRSEAESASERAGSYEAEVVAVVEANIDDLAPSVMAYAMEKLLQEGALDVCLTPIVMKKGRLAQKLSVIARPCDRQKIIALIIAETSTIGTRSYFCERLTLSRDFQEVSIGSGPKIRLKVARDGQGRLVNVQPEYEDCVQFARESDIPLKEVLIRCLGKASELLDSQEKA